MLLIDEDWSKADPAQLRALGYGAVIGYVSQDTTGKNLSAADVAAIHGAGLAVGLVFEYAPQSALGGASAGTRDARIAVAGAQALGAPPGVALYTAIDFDTTSDAQRATCLAYAQAFDVVCRAAGYRSGVYGEFELCAYLAAHGYGGFLWETYAWSGGQWYAGAVLRQELNGITVAGATVDRDESLAADWGQWEAEMAMTDEELIKIITEAARMVQTGATFQWGFLHLTDPAKYGYTQELAVKAVNPSGALYPTLANLANGLAQANAALTAIAGKVDLSPAELDQIKQVSQAAATAALQAQVSDFAHQVVQALPADLGAEVHTAVIDAVHAVAAALGTAQ